MSEKDRSSGMGTSRIVEDYRRKQKELLEVLEGTETEYREVPPEEIRALFSVQDEIDRFLEAHSESNSPLLLPVIEGLLNAFPVWKAKFTTGDYGKSRSELIIDPDRDSVYYVTPSGFSLRLKKEVLYDPEMHKRGKNTLAHVIQPFADLIVFRSSGERYNFKRDPGIGLVVREFLPLHLMTLLRGDVRALFLRRLNFMWMTQGFVM